MNSPDVSYSSSKGRAGGRAGGAGYDFQDLYVALQLASLLVSDGDPPVEVLWEKKAVDLGRETGAEPVYVDDAILLLKSGKCVYVQVKETSPQGGWSVKQLVRTSVMRHFWRQWMSKAAEDRPHTVLRLASRGDMTTLESMLDVAGRSRTPQELLSDEASAEIASEISALAAALELQTDSAELLAFLACIQAEQLPTAIHVEKLIAQRLATFGDDAPDLARRLTRMVGRSKHPGHDARSSFTKETLVAALRADGFAEDKLIAAGVVRANPIDDAVWDWHRDQVVQRFRSFRIYGLQVDRDVYADLPALFVPLRLVPIRADRPFHNEGMRARTGRSLAERLSAEVERLPEDADDRDKHRHPGKGDALDLAGVLAEKRRFAIVGGPGVGKTTTLKWLAITSTLPGDEGQRLRLSFGMPDDPLIPVYVRFRQFAERVHARDLAGIAGRVGLVSDFLRAELQGGLAGGVPTREKALQMAQYLLESDKTLFLFDGLDEVADEGMRSRLFEAVADLMQAYKAPRIVVTSRPYAFRQDRSPLELALFEPLPLDREARQTFAQQWYRAVRRNLVAPLEEGDARARADDLALAADSLPDLSEVPLLLSILALVHFNRRGLPIERATLYDHATLAMLGHWERDPAGRDLGDDAVPADWSRRLSLNETEIRRIVEYLAQRIQVHAGGGDFDRADAIASLTEGLEFLSPGRNPDAHDRGELLLRLLVDRSGLVQERSPSVFAFVHLSFQEYLTARWFVGREDNGLQELARLSADERHGEVCRLAVAILSAEQRVETDERVASLIKSLGSHSPALAAACILEAPRVRLDKSYAERLARATFSECADPRGHYYSPRVVARLVWAFLKHTSEADRVLLEILSDSGEGFEEHPFRRMKGREFDDREFHSFRRHVLNRNPAFAVLASRPPGPLTPELAWVLCRMSSIRRDSAAGLPRHLGELLMIEAGEAKAQDHIPALVRLLTTGDSERSSVEALILPRVEHVLAGLWDDEQTRSMVRDVLANSLSLKTLPNEGPSHNLAWGAARFLMVRGERTVPGLADAVTIAGLVSRSRHTEVNCCLHALADDPSTRETTLKALKSGLENPDSDVRRGCFRVLVDIGLIPPAAAGLDDEAKMLPRLLTDCATAKETIAVLAENLWSEEPATAWRVAKALVDCGNVAMPGVPQTIVNAGLVVARSLAMQYVRQLYGDPTQNVSIVGALFGALSSMDDHVAASAGLLLLELQGTDNQRFLKRLTRAILRDPHQINDSLPLLRRLIHDERASRAVLETISEQLGDKPDDRVASSVARMLAAEGMIGVRNLAKALVNHGLRQASDHREIGHYLKKMLADPEAATTTRRTLFDGLSSEDGNVKWGSACSLWEAGSRTDPKVARALAGPAGLGTLERREQAGSWLLV